MGINKPSFEEPRAKHQGGRQPRHSYRVRESEQETAARRRKK